MWHLSAPQNKKERPYRNLFISLKICNSNYSTVKIFIHKENRFSVVILIAKKENSLPCGRKANYRVANPWNE
jgi:hypothetical protein